MSTDFQERRVSCRDSNAHMLLWSFSLLAHFGGLDCCRQTTSRLFLVTRFFDEWLTKRLVLKETARAPILSKQGRSPTTIHCIYKSVCSSCSIHV